MAQILGEEIRSSLKCARVKADSLDDLIIPAAFGIAADWNRAAEPLPRHGL